MSTTPKIGEVIDALFALAENTSADMAYDGPTVTSESVTSFIIVGGTEDPDDEPSSFNQDWNGLGARGKIETGEVTCAVLVGSGNQEVKAARDQALGLVAEFETAVRSDPSLGGVLVGGWAHVSSGRLTQRLNSQGLYVRMLFTVSYQTKN